jgi:hypothetical protein
MITIEEANKENAVEELFCKKFEQLKKYPLDEDNSGFLVNLLISRGNIEIPEKEKPFLIKLIEKRIKNCLTYQITDTRLLIFLAILSENPGTAVMYLAYLQYWAKKNNQPIINLTIFCEKIFPWGFPNENDLSDLWNKCKVKREKQLDSDNLLDYDNAYKSIQF